MSAHRTAENPFMEFYYKMLKKFCRRALILVVVTICTASLSSVHRLGFSSVMGQEPASDAIARLTTDVEYLASDALAGRDVGSEGIALAGNYIAERFQQLRLVTDSFDAGPYQEFTIPGPPTLGTTERNVLRISGADEGLKLELGVNFTPVSLGINGTFNGQVVFAGYGITAPDLNYDDYAGIDVAGKVVIVLRKEPNQSDPTSKFDGTRPSQHAFFSTKELNAAMHQAAALIVVNDRSTVAAAGSDQLPDIAGAGNAISEKQIPTLYCLRSVVDGLLKSTGQTLDDLEAAIDTQTSPQSRLLNGVSIAGETNIQQSQTPVRNVVGVLPGVGQLAEEFVVVGAHYDHVGMGGVGSLAPGTIEVHNGADDNASGTSVLLEVARLAAANQSPSRRTIVLVAFTAEERGLLGSKHYIRNPRWPLERTVAMLNMDMVGRMTADSLTVYGTGTATQFDQLTDRHSQASGLVIDKQPAGFGPSDHSSFYEVDIPVFHFFTGLHNDYHRPSDDFDKVNVAGMARIANFVADMLLELATMPERPTLIKSAAVAQIGNPSRRQRAMLGVRLSRDANAPPTVLAVTPEGAARIAGIMEGDIIVAIGGQQLASTGELQRTLSTSAPGDTVSISIQRGNEKIELTVVLQGGG